MTSPLERPPAAADERQRILVAGATGVVGRRLLPTLVASGHTVYGLARTPAAAETIAALGARPITGDVLHPDGVMEAVREARPSVVIHQATALRFDKYRPRRMERMMAATNALRTTGTANLVAAAERHGVQRLIAQSIAFAYAHAGPDALDETAPLDLGAPGGWGSVARAVLELEERVMGTAQVQGVVLRYGGFYGPGTAMSADGAIAQLARARRLPVVGSGRGQTPMVHIDDVIGATLDAVERGWGVYNVVDDVPAPAAEWIPEFAAAVGAPPPRHVPAWVARIAAGPHAVRVMTTQRGALNAKAKAELGWQPEYSDWRAGFRSLRADPRTPARAPSAA